VLLMTAVTVLSAWAALRFNRLKNDAETARHTIEVQRDTIGRQLDENQLAEVKSREQLSRFLLRTAQAEMAGRSGGKREALAALSEAAALSRRLDLPTEYRNTLRREYVAALARTDLAVRPDRVWSVPGFTDSSPVAFCPDGTLFAISVEPGVVSVRAANTNEEMRRLTGPAGETAVGMTNWLRFSRTHKHLVGLHGRTLRVWNVPTGKLTQQLGPVAGSTFDFHPDESALAWVDSKNRVRVRNLTTGTEQFFKPLPFRPTWLRYDPTGRRLAVCGQGERAVHVLDLDAEEWSACPMPAQTDRVAWAPDGVRLAAASTASTDVYVTNRLTPLAAPIVIRGHTGRVVQVAFHPTDEVLATAAWDQTVRVWDLTRPEAPELAVRKAFSLSYCSLEFSADGSQLGMGVANNRLWVWEWMRPTAGELVLSSRLGRVWGAALSPDGSTAAALGERGLEVWDLARPQQPNVAYPASPQTAEGLSTLVAFGLDWDDRTAGRRARDRIAQLKSNPFAAVAGRRVRFSADGRELLIGAVGGVTRATVLTDPPGTFRLTAAVTRREMGGYEHAWSADGTLVAVVPERGKIAVYDTATHERVVAVPRHGNSGYTAVSPDNRWLATGSWPQPGVNVWDIRTGDQVGSTLPTSNSGHPTFSADGRWLVIGSGDGYQFYHTAGWKPAHRVPRTDCGHFPGPAAFTPDSTTAAVWTRPGQVSLIDPTNGNELAVLPITVRSDSIDTLGELRFTADGRKLVVVADARRIQIWDIATLREQLAAVDLDWGVRPE
jgi:WD40 repeat protein